MALIKMGNFIINTDNITFVNLRDEDAFGEEKDCLTIAFVGGEQLYFSGREAEIFKWYFNHPTSDVVDIENLSGK